MRVLRVSSLALFAISCTVETALPSEATISCTTAADRCPAGWQCVTALGQCRRATDACVIGGSGGLVVAPDNNECTLESGEAGICLAGACLPPTCGDALVNGDEACDSGTSNSDFEPDACRTTCELPRCGDGVLDSGEQCDDTAGNIDEPDRCRTTCELPRCGDGITDVAEGEECDQGASNSDTTPDACRTDCRLPYCGDGVPDSTDALDSVCDDGDGIDNNNCTNACTTAACGDGVLWNQGSGNEACDDGNNNTEACVYGTTECLVCDSSCRPVLGATSYCGDGRIDAAESEACDDGNTNALDGCDACQITPRFLCTKEPSRCAFLVFVDPNASGTGDGSSWAEAITTLRDALDVTSTGNVELWVAEGVYLPDQGGGATTGDTTATFTIPNGFAVYGGFAGNETTRSARDVDAHPTILSGDLNGDDGPGFTNRTDNAIHVVTAIGVDETTVLDGVQITGGYTDGIDGAGLRLVGADLHVVGVTFSENMAQLAKGGAVHILSGSPTFSSCTFSNNRASWGGAIGIAGGRPLFIGVELLGNVGTGGGALYTIGGQPRFLHSRFVGNAAGIFGGGAVYAVDSSTNCVGCLFIGNDASGGPAVFYQQTASTSLRHCTMANNGSTPINGGTLAVRNSVLWQTGSVEMSGLDGADVAFTCVEQPGGYTSDPSNVVGTDPEFVDAAGADGVPGTADDDLRLSSSSPCIDAGSNSESALDFADLDTDGDTEEPLPFDLAGADRFVDHANPDTGEGTPPIIDMGAFEAP